MAKKTMKRPVPEFLRSLNTATLEGFMKSAGISAFGIFDESWNRDESSLFSLTAKGNTVNVVRLPLHERAKLGENPVFIGHDQTCRALYAEPDGHLWIAEIKIRTDENIERSMWTYISAGSPCGCGRTTFLNSCHVKCEGIFVQVREASGFEFVDDLLQSEEEVGDIAYNINPYGLAFCNSYGCDIASWLMAPQLELIKKAGYRLADRFMKNRIVTKKHAFSVMNPYRSETTKTSTEFNRLCKNGHNLNHVFTVPKSIYRVMKDVINIDTWDEIRRLGKRIALDEDTAGRLANEFEGKKLSKMCHILKYEHDGKPVFTVSSLMNYLTRVDAYEAIDNDEALELIDDYLMMCKNIGKAPVVDGDSLKREHDVTAREGRLTRTSEYDEGIKKRAAELDSLSYSEEYFFARPIRDFADLLDESNQQSNCLAAAYPKAIADGWSNIFVIRSRKEPDKSLITIEIGRDKKMRQCYLSHNRKVTKPAHKAFIDRWLKAIA